MSEIIPKTNTGGVIFTEADIKRRVCELLTVLHHCKRTDKTRVYEYGEKLRSGEKPGTGSRFATPRELAHDAIVEAQCFNFAQWAGWEE